MGKPDWKDAPKWAKWLAQDFDGFWYWYSDKPWTLNESLRWWMSVSPSFEELSSIAISSVDGPNPKWYETLEERP